jgi:hypothetical protein
MGGYGSGRRGGGPTVQSAFRVEIDALLPGVRGGCVIRFSGPYRDLDGMRNSFRSIRSTGQGSAGPEVDQTRHSYLQDMRRN